MEEAYLKSDCDFDGYNYTCTKDAYDGPKANKLYFETGKKHEYLCPHCFIPMTCANETVDFTNPQRCAGKRNPYFTPKKNDGSHESCPGNQKNYIKSLRKLNSFTVEPKFPYFSKLIVPDPNDTDPPKSIVIEKSAATKDSSEDENIESHKENGNTRYLKHICEHYLSIKKNNPARINDNNEKDFTGLKTALEERDLYLPYIGKTNYYRAFRRAQSSEYLDFVQGRYRIFHGKLREVAKLIDGYYLVFNFPYKMKGWGKPVIVWLGNNVLYKFEKEAVTKLLDKNNLINNPICYVFGKLDDCEDHYSITVDHLPWICFLQEKSGDRNKSIKCYKKGNTRKEVVPEMIGYLADTAEKYLARKQDQEKKPFESDDKKNKKQIEIGESLKTLASTQSDCSSTNISKDSKDSFDFYDQKNGDTLKVSKSETEEVQVKGLRVSSSNNNNPAIPVKLKASVKKSSYINPVVKETLSSEVTLEKYEGAIRRLYKKMKKELAIAADITKKALAKKG